MKPSLFGSSMLLKHLQHNATHLTPLDLLGSDETGLSKAFAYVLAKDQDALFTFLHFIGVPSRNTQNNFLATSVEIEHVRPEGRTDIEIFKPGSFHVIVECKIDKGKIQKQRTQYLSSFENAPHRMMCFITQERDTNKQKHDGIITRHLSWMDILEVFEGTRLTNKPVAHQFMAYAIRTYKMKTQKEILVQDLSNPTELERYLKYQVYKRDVTFGTPLYFAPYFTRNAGESIGQGIKYLSRVLGVLTLRPPELDEYRSDLESFTDDPAQVQRWIKGIKLGSKAYRSMEHTFYFLDEPVKLPVSLRKDGTIKKGRGKNWIAGMIPKNRCVTFAEFIRRFTAERSNIREMLHKI